MTRINLICQRLAHVAGKGKCFHVVESSRVRKLMPIHCSNTPDLEFDLLYFSLFSVSSLAIKFQGFS